jgi:cell wall-associated NlpC family hydrolase
MNTGFLKQIPFWLFLGLIISTGAHLPEDRMAQEERLLRNQLVGYAQQYVGLPYHYGGTCPETGFDCSGFIRFVLNDFGFDVTRTSRGQSHEGFPVTLQRVEPGDLLFFGRNGRVGHVGMVVRRDASGVYFVHSSRRGIVVDNLYGMSYYSTRILWARDVISEQLIK